MGHLDKALKAMQQPEIYFDLIENTLMDINQRYQPGLIQWIREQPDRWARLLQLEGMINEMTLSGDEGRLRKALDGYRMFFDSMVKEFGSLEWTTQCDAQALIFRPLEE